MEDLSRLRMVLEIVKQPHAMDVSEGDFTGSDALE